ncbi:MAG: GNAT family N-acetyltransferase [Candidatus Baltobacteraceae bacterium]
MMEVLSVSAEEVRPLRHALLRPGAKMELSVYPGDDEPSSLHLGLYDGQTLVGIATVINEPLPESQNPNSWRLRGMALQEKYRNRGEGTKMLEICIAYVSEADGEVFWCNGRIAARSFYEREGFQVQGEQFDVPISGPHYLFVKKL